MKLIIPQLIYGSIHLRNCDLKEEKGKQQKFGFDTGFVSDPSERLHNESRTLPPAMLNSDVLTRRVLEVCVCNLTWNVYL